MMPVSDVKPEKIFALQNPVVWADILDMHRQVDIAGIYPRYGTKNCYDCGAESIENTPFWERFVELHGERYSIPCCDACLDVALSPGKKAATE